jgi:hypothetical protein
MQKLHYSTFSVLHTYYSFVWTLISVLTPTFRYLWQWILSGIIIYTRHLTECRNQFNWSISSFGCMNNLLHNNKVMTHNTRIKVQAMKKVQRSSKINHTILGNISLDSRLLKTLCLKSSYELFHISCTRFKQNQVHTRNEKQITNDV